jgi:hypothetical protein
VPALPLLEVLDYHLAGRDPGTLGHGPDPYDRSRRDRDHPMAYALYARGLVTLFRATGDDRYLGLARGVLEQLAGLAGRERAAWGLGFAWRGQDAALPFTVTTALAGLAFLDHHEASGESWTSEQVERTCRWLTRALPWAPSGDGIAPWYAPGMPFVLPNVTSLVAGLLHRWGALIGDGDLQATARLARRAVEQAHRPDGFWTYGYAGIDADAATRPSATIDAQHLAYVLEGLSACSGSDAWPGAQATIEFIARHLVVDRRLIEKVGLVDRDEPDDGPRSQRRRRLGLETKVLPSGSVVAVYPAEARVGSYGATIRALARGSALGIPASWDAMDALVTRVLTRHATDPSGRFAYLAGDRAWFPRQEAHLFDGLAAVAAVGDAASGAW